VPKHQTMKLYRGVEVKLSTSLILALDGDKWLISHSSYFTLRVNVPLTHWMGTWASLGATIDMVVKK